MGIYPVQLCTAGRRPAVRRYPGNWVAFFFSLELPMDFQFRWFQSLIPSSLKYYPKGLIINWYPYYQCWTLTYALPSGYTIGSTFGYGWDPKDDVWSIYFWNKVDYVMKRSQTRLTSGGAPTPAPVCPFLADFPLLAEHLTAVVFDDGESRQTSTISVFTGDGHWKVMLRDRAAKLVLFVSGPTFVDTLLLLEAALESPTTVWRVDTYGTDAPASRVKRK